MSVKTAPRRYRSEIRTAAADQTRARILAAARTLLTGGEGLPAYSVDGVARQAGVTRLTVYNQFESKRGLLEAVFDEMAERGGLLNELPAVFAEVDARRALHRMVGVFCRFWAAHGSVIPKLSAMTKLDEEVAASLHERTERRRHVLDVLVQRLGIGPPAARADLVDTLFALTSFEMYEALAINQRSDESVQALLQGLVEDAVSRHESGSGKTPTARRRSKAR